MDKIWLILALIGLVLTCSAAILTFWYFTLLNRRIFADEARISCLEGILQAEEEAESARLSAQGKEGVKVREANKEMRQSAMNEVRTMIGTPGDLQSKLPQLAALVAKYPKVADEVADQAIREFHLEPYKDVIKGFIAVELQKVAAGGPQSQGEMWYGLRL